MNVEQANDAVFNIQSTVFFNKLASLGINPQSQQDAVDLWTLGVNLLNSAPRETQDGVMIKQASVSLFGNATSPIMRSGFSKEAELVAEELLTKHPESVEVVATLLSVPTA